MLLLAAAVGRRAATLARRLSRMLRHRIAVELRLGRRRHPPRRRVGIRMRQGLQLLSVAALDGLFARRLRAL